MDLLLAANATRDTSHARTRRTVMATRHTIVIIVIVAGLLLAASHSPLGAQPSASTASSVASALSPADITHPENLPTIGKWMIDRVGSIAHWLGEMSEGKALREPINVILVDEGASDAEDAKRRIVAAATSAGYPIRFGHSTGYGGFIGGVLYAQLPAGRDDAFSNAIFEVSNNHGRIFGPHRDGGSYVFVGAFSREQVRLFHSPHHGYASFNRARDDFSQNLDGRTPFKRVGFVNLSNAIVGDAKVTTGDHDGLAVLLRAGR
jgi:hypothetical protein